MRNKVSISVVIPIYNTAVWLKDSITSVLEQSFSSFELILIDDGSTDESLKICNEMADKDKRISVYHIENAGVSHARNFGISKATGEYICFMDSDDLIPKDSLKVRYDAMTNNSQCDLVLGLFSSNEQFSQSEKTGIYSLCDFISDFFVNISSTYYGGPCNKLYKLRIIKEYNIVFPESIDWCEDFIFNVEYYKHCEFVYYAPQDVYFYNRHEESLSSNGVKLTGLKLLQITLLRYNTVKSLLSIFCKDSYDENVSLFFASRIHIILSQIFNEERKTNTLREKYRDVNYILSLPEVKEIIFSYKTKKNYKALTYLKRNFVRNRIKRIFFIYYVKSFLRSIKVITKIFRKSRLEPSINR